MDGHNGPPTSGGFLTHFPFPVMLKAEILTSTISGADRIAEAASSF
jgi:hypothetical protein